MLNKKVVGDCASSFWGLQRPAERERSLFFHKINWQTSPNLSNLEAKSHLVDSCLVLALSYFSYESLNYRALNASNHLL